MSLFTPIIKKTAPSTEEHPTYQYGQRIGQWSLEHYNRAGTYLNAWQHRVGFRRRNYFILGVLLSLLFYFIYDLLTLF